MKKANRVWLNPEKTQMAFMAWSVAVERRGEVEADLEFADCNRQVNLEFSVYASDAVGRKRVLKKRLRKLRIIQKELAAFEAALLECLK